MSEWWTLRLSDFLMFSPATYWRMVERYNRDAWPLQLGLAAVAAWLVWMVAARRPMAVRAVPAVLAAVWAWVGWAFHWERYAQINWAAEYLAWAFWFQAALLLACCGFERRDGAASSHARVRACGLGLAVVGVLAYPLVGVAAGRPWIQADMFGLMPQPTAIATFGLLLATIRRAWLLGWLLIVPAISMLVGLATWWVFRG